VGLCLAKLKILLDKYGFGVTPPSEPAGPDRETTRIKVGGVRFGKIAVDFLAFSSYAMLCYATVSFGLPRP